MLYDIIPLIIIFLCLGIIIFILIKKFPLMANVDLEQIPGEKQARVKELIIQRRLEEKINWLAKKLNFIFSPFKTPFSKISLFFKKPFAVLEEKLHFKQMQFLKNEPEKIKQFIISLINEGEKLMRDKNYNIAEKKFVQALSMDEKNIRAYQNLGEVYLEQKHYTYALQTFQHVLRLYLKQADFLKGDNQDNGELKEMNAKIAELYALMSSIYQAMGQSKKSLENMQQALELSPKNPKYLDFICETCIILKDKEGAEQALARLKEVNAENQKIAEWEEKIKEL